MPAKPSVYHTLGLIYEELISYLEESETVTNAYIDYLLYEMMSEGARVCKLISPEEEAKLIDEIAQVLRAFGVTRVMSMDEYLEFPKAGAA